MQLLEQRLELLGPHRWPPLVDLGVRRVRRVDDCGGRARLVADANEVVEDRLRCQLLDDARAGTSAGETGRDDGNVEQLQRTCDVDPLAACKRQALARAVSVTELEIRDRKRPVDCRVES